VDLNLLLGRSDVKSERPEGANVSITHLDHSQQCNHQGEAVRVGQHQIHAWGTMYARINLNQFDVVVSLREDDKGLAGVSEEKIFRLPLKDFGGTGDDWEGKVRTVACMLEAGLKVVAFCAGSHGRTGTLIASLIAVMEPAKNPIKTARERHCSHAVETEAQETAIHALHDSVKRERRSQMNTANGSNEIFVMEGTERTREYVVIAATNTGRVGVRNIYGGFRIRVEPRTKKLAKEVACGVNRNWKQYGQSGQPRFSRVANSVGQRNRHVAWGLDAIGAVGNGDATVNPDAPRDLRRLLEPAHNRNVARVQTRIATA
jgi:hypothetical protein